MIRISKVHMIQGQSSDARTACGAAGPEVTSATHQEKLVTCVECNRVAGRIHVFEKAGLGLAPFRCTGMEKKTYQACIGAPIQPGGVCDYCGQGIMFVFAIRDRDGKTFNVGSDCVLRTGDANLKKVVAEEMRKVNREKASAKAAIVNDALWRILQDPDSCAKLEAVKIEMRPGWTQTALQQISWLYENAGAAGKARALRQAKKILDRPYGA